MTTNITSPVPLQDQELDSITGASMQNDLDTGRLVCEVGVAAAKPAEFVVFRIGQTTADIRR